MSGGPQKHGLREDFLKEYNLKEEKNVDFWGDRVREKILHKAEGPMAYLREWQL